MIAVLEETQNLERARSRTVAASLEGVRAALRPTLGGIELRRQMSKAENQADDGWGKPDAS
jgi:hypothetical protein